jgi:hypothetical protein
LIKKDRNLQKFKDVKISKKYALSSESDESLNKSRFNDLKKDFETIEKLKKKK